MKGFRKKSIALLLWALAMVPLLSQPAASDEVYCCLPIAFIATYVEISTETYNCCCPEGEADVCEEREGRTTHRYGGYLLDYECGIDSEACAEDEYAVPCNSTAPQTELEHESTVALDESVCECVQEEGCYIMPPDCVFPDSWFTCDCDEVEEGCVVPAGDPYYHPECDPGGLD